jgi:hypothetical protein
MSTLCNLFQGRACCCCRYVVVVAVFVITAAAVVVAAGVVLVVVVKSLSATSTAATAAYHGFHSITRVFCCRLTTSETRFSSIVNINIIARYLITIQ